MKKPFEFLVNGSLEVLHNPHPIEKIKAARKIFTQWEKGSIPSTQTQSIQTLQNNLPLYPPRPEKPIQLPSHQMGSHLTAGVSQSVWLLHSVAHVEYYAIDLAFDLIVRWAHLCDPNLNETKPKPSTLETLKLPLNFFRDWLAVGNDEASHFWLLKSRLKELGHPYGSLPGHNSLWESAVNSADDLLGRLVVIPLVQEARGLDAHPRMVEKLIGCGDKESARLIDLICYEEIAHVQAGVKWFTFVCSSLGLDEEEEFQKAIKKYVPGGVLPCPFNVYAREISGIKTSWYSGVATGSSNFSTSFTLNYSRIAESRDAYKLSQNSKLHEIDNFAKE